MPTVRLPVVGCVLREERGPADALTDELLDNGEGTWDAGSGSEVSGAGSSTAALADAQPHAQREDSRKGPGLL